eukprot:TRINITY_DN9253_c0_g2_i1.p1 TRINITY_DN9253_c0_g2~~TRINITY_DN9253_c0_g2_i1.p1  ORF type:complete len:197 (-),score=-30.55 TRINITY_DN9253_c0_g2_i1:38-628(-)
MTAARSLGMSRAQAIRSIILPQAMRIALPGWSNEYPEILTESSICYAIGVAELLTRSSQIVSQTYVTMPIYLACAVMFILLSYAGTHLIQRLEMRIAIPGFGPGSSSQYVRIRVYSQGRRYTQVLRQLGSPQGCLLQCQKRGDDLFYRPFRYRKEYPASVYQSADHSGQRKSGSTIHLQKSISSEVKNPQDSACHI